VANPEGPKAVEFYRAPGTKSGLLWDNLPVWHRKPYSFGQEEFAARLQSDGVPCILMDGDMADKRDHAAGGRRSRLEAILERMEKRLDPKRTK